MIVRSLPFSPRSPRKFISVPGKPLDKHPRLEDRQLPRRGPQVSVLPEPDQSSSCSCAGTAAARARRSGPARDPAVPSSSQAPGSWPVLPQSSRPRPQAQPSSPQERASAGSSQEGAALHCPRVQVPRFRGREWTDERAARTLRPAPAQGDAVPAPHVLSPAPLTCGLCAPLLTLGQCRADPAGPRGVERSPRQ